MAGHRFSAVLGEQDGERPLVLVPPQIAAELGGRGRIPVVGTVNGTPFRSSTMPVGGGRHCVGFRREIRDAAGIEIGDRVEVGPPHRADRGGAQSLNRYLVPRLLHLQPGQAGSCSARKASARYGWAAVMVTIVTAGRRVPGT